VSVEHGDLTERLSWLLKTKNRHLLGTGYWPNDFCPACDVLGILGGAKSVKSDQKTLPGVAY